MEEDVVVCAIDTARQIKTVTACNKSDAGHYAKYYRSIGYNAKIMTYEELEAYEAKQQQERIMSTRYYNSYTY